MVTSPFSRWDTPAPLAAAAALTAVQGVVIVLVAVADAVSVSSDRLVMGVTTALFFAAYGVALIWCAWGMNRRRPWSRGPVLLAELIFLGLAWSFRAAPTTWLAAVLAVVSLLILAGLLHPASLAALSRPDPED
ncbi:hypothetical protein D9V37_03495 [Nocardioides mangrovicus]|uniref:Uncharacterized protein n=1 Tax=Nocardioides mangrovicus TaxID=2478913 RepID=A0A3L8P857_9ACTN|nr:hypothetical protein [Nocardioides mangrovicus]RLV51003.1 hypothetical protein D9V37_03495 [Nocardioides mangrovicus]